MLECLHLDLRKPVGEFLISHVRRTKSVMLSVANFVSNMLKVALVDSGLQNLLLSARSALNESEITAITRSVNSALKKAQTSTQSSLLERVEAQKRLLKTKPAPRSPAAKRPPALSSRSPPPRRSPLTSPTSASSRRTSPRCGRKKPLLDPQPRFDPPNYIKPISMFSSPRAASPGRSLMDVIRQNSLAELSKKARFPPSPRRDIRTSDERALTSCTFHPRTNSAERRYQHVRSRICPREETKRSVSGPAGRKLKRAATSSDCEVVLKKRELESRSFTAGTSACVYDAKSARSLKNLLSHGYSFTYEERRYLKRQRSWTRESNSESLVQSRIMNKSKGTGSSKSSRVAAGSTGENSAFITSSFMLELMKDKSKSPQRSPISSLRKCSYDDHKPKVAESFRSVLNGVSKTELQKIQNLHEKYVLLGEGRPASPQRGEHILPDPQAM